METRKIANMNVNRVGLGGIPLQKLEEAKRFLSYASSKGINFIDTARGYTVSEALIGEYLKDNRQNFFVATKSMAKTYIDMKKDIEISLNNLQTNYIDLYQLHNVSRIDDFIYRMENAFKALDEALQKGLILNIGITIHSYDFLRYLLESEEVKLFKTIQIPFNYLEGEIDVLEKASKLGLGIIIMKPFAGGEITKANLAIKYLLSHDFVDVIIPGMSTFEEVDQNTTYTNYQLTKEEMDEIKNHRESVKDVFCHRCGYCLPCSQGIDIPSIFTLEKYFLNYKLDNWAEIRYNGLLKKGSDCTGCNLCLKRCPYHINIPKKMKEIDKLITKK